MNINFNNTLKAQLKGIANRKGISIPALVVQIITEYLANNQAPKTQHKEDVNK